jgi:hypothetical protein
MARRAEAKLYISCEYVQIPLLETDMHTLLQKQNSFPSMVEVARHKVLILWM